jgi:hypothetical protein
VSASLPFSLTPPIWMIFVGPPPRTGRASTTNVSPSPRSKQMTGDSMRSFAPSMCGMVSAYCPSLRIRRSTAHSSLHRIEGYRRINLPELCGPYKEVMGIRITENYWDLGFRYSITQAPSLVSSSSSSSFSYSCLRLPIHTEAKQIVIDHQLPTRKKQARHN